MSSDLAIGVDLGATNVKVGLGSFERGILKKIEEKTVRGEGAERLIDQVSRLIRLVAENKLTKVRAIGIGSIGTLDLVRGVILNPANASFRNVPIVEVLSERFKLPVYLLNDCSAAVLGEKAFGAGRGLDNLFYVTLSSGIGGGAIVNGTLLLGKDGNAVEIGHISVDFDDGLPCPCGSRGHWEAYCSGRSIPVFARYLVDKSPEKFRGSLLERLIADGSLTPEILFDMARNGDRYALEVVNEIGKINAIGFANINTLYDPELITVGGSIALNNEKLILEPIMKDIKRYTVNRLPKIMVTPLGGDAVLHGAMALAIKPPPSLVVSAMG